MGKSLQFKLGVGISLLVFLIASVGDYFVYQYTQTLFLEQHKRLMVQDLRRCGESIDNLGEDIQLIAQSIAIDAQIQTFYRAKIHDYYQIEDALRRVGNHTAIKMYLTSFAFVCDAGEPPNIYWSSNPYEPYFAQQMEQPWYQQLGGENGSFSQVHSLKAGTAKDVFTYQYFINDSLRPTRTLGKILLNVDVEKFSAELDRLTLPYQAYFLADADTGQALITRGELDSHQALQAVEANGGSFVPYEDGFLTSSYIKTMNWVICTYTPASEVRGKLTPLLYFFLLYIPLSIFVIALCIELFVQHCTRPIPIISKAILDFAKGKREVRLDIRTHDELEILGDEFNAMADSIQAYIQQAIADERIKKKIRFDMLMSKIHPHFLYNTLNSVIYLARRNGDRDIEEMVTALITILQDGMAAYTGQVWGPLSEELHIVRAYEAIQKYRYKDKFSIQYQVPDQLQSAYLPKNILQLLVENAIYHGIVPKSEPGVVTICAEEENGQLRITVCDDGVGMEEEQVRRLLSPEKSAGTVHSLGVSNLRDRLDYFYPEEHQFEIYSEKGKGTIIVLQIPLGYEPLQNTLEDE